MKTQCETQLKELTAKKHIFFTDRGNSSILLALKLAKNLGKKKAFIQDQGGWITYGQFLRKLKFEVINLETDYGVIKLNSLKEPDDSSLLLINSMPGYHALQEDIGKIEKLCRDKKCILINDVSGSIGRKESKHGDIILGSFGEWKPVEVKYGGFIAFDEPSYEKFFKDNFAKEVRDFYKELDEKLKELASKLKRIDETTEEIKEKLKNFEIIHRQSKGLVVIARFNNDEEKMKLLDFCRLFGYEHTLCPRYIRVLENAISIEVKRG
jgi:hypothetical protein